MFSLSRRVHTCSPVARYLTLAVSILLAHAALGNTFNVNSTDDILNPPPGVVTLRSAIQSANSTSGGNTINLTVAGIYKITNSGAFTMLPSGGDLTIVNTSGGTVVIDGNKVDRVFDINPAASSSPVFTVTMRGFTITNGLAQAGDGAIGSGGGIRSQSVASLTLTGMIVTGNEATADGGGIAMENATPASWVLTITNSTISNNHAGDSGGGIESDGPGSIVLDNGSVVSGNTALNQGGGIFLDFVSEGVILAGANLTMSGAEVSGNKALGPAAVGGGIANAGNGTVTISGSTVQNNSSGGSGGGFADVNCQGTLTVSFSAFLANTTSNNGGAITDCAPTTTIGSSEIDGNSAFGSGGAVFASGTTLSIGSSTFANNTASSNGGAIEVQTTGTGSSASSITNSTVTANTVDNNGGGNGGGIDAPFSFSGSLSLIGVTISSNFSANGGGIFWAGSSGSLMSVVNTIVATNIASSSGPDANNPAGSFADDGGNLIGVAGAGSGNTGFTAGTTQTGTVAKPLDPMVGPLQNNGGPTLTQAPLAGSPAIDRGLTISVALDQRGVRRPQGSNFDAGAEELNQGPTPSATLSGNNLDFGSQPLGVSTSLEVAIIDSGTAALTLSNVSLSGTNAGDFSITPPLACATLPATIQARSSCPYKVTFRPSATGARTAEVTFTDNHLNAPNSTQTVALSGTGFVKANSSVTLALTKGTNPSTFGSSLTFTATVTPSTATGTVTFFDGATMIGSGTVNSGGATFTISSLAIGAHSITAHYGGDAFDKPAISAPLVQHVLAITATSLTSSENPSVFGQNVTFTATVTSATAGTITGSVTFKDGSHVIGTGTVSSGKATLTISTLSVAVHSITAVYSGNATYAASTSPAVSHTVDQASTSTAVTSSLNPSKFGQPVTFTATVTVHAPGAGTPNGTLTFKDGTTTLGTKSLVSGKATFTTSTLSVGVHSITATYDGSTDFHTSVSPVLSQTVK